MPVVVEVTISTSEDAISLANSTGRIHPSKLYECLKWCLDEYMSNQELEWLYAFSAFIKRSEATEKYARPYTQRLNKTCVWNVFSDILEEDDPNLHLIDCVVQSVDYNIFRGWNGFGFLHEAICRQNVKLVKFLVKKFDFHINGIAQVGGDQYTPLLCCLHPNFFDLCESSAVILELLLAQPGIDLSAGNVKGYTTVESFLINGKRCVEIMLQDGRYDSTEVGKALSKVIGVRNIFTRKNFSTPRLLLQWEEDRLDASEKSLEKIGVPPEVASRILSFIFPSGLATYKDADGHSISEAMEFFRRCHPLVDCPPCSRGLSWEQHYKGRNLKPAETFDDAPWKDVTQRFRAFEKRVEKYEQFRRNN